VFGVIHQLIISPIWFSIVALLVAGAVCGTCLAWSYALIFVGILVGLGLVSLLMFKPVTTIPALLRSNAPPRALIAQALPVTAWFMAGSAVLLTVVYRPGWRGAVAILATTVVVVLSLGLNISILGLVFVPKASAYVLAEVLVLIVSLALVYAGVMGIIWRNSLLHRASAA
jgi:hypothetical protein